MKDYIKIEDAVVYLEEIAYMKFDDDLEYDELEYDEFDGDVCFNMVVGFKGGGKVVINLGEDGNVAMSKYKNYVGVIIDAKDELRKEKEQLLLG